MQVRSLIGQVSSSDAGGSTCASQSQKSQLFHFKVTMTSLALYCQVQAGLTEIFPATTKANACEEQCDTGWWLIAITLCSNCAKLFDDILKNFDLPRPWLSRLSINDGHSLILKALRQPRNLELQAAWFWQA